MGWARAVLRGLALPALIVVAAQIAASLWLGQSDSLAAPSAIATAFAQSVLDASLFRLTGETLFAALSGLVLGGGLGLLAGALLGASRSAARLLYVSLEVFRPIPSVALLPVALLVFGFGYRMEISIVGFACFWPMVIIGQLAIGGVEPRLLEVSRALRLGWLAHFGKIVLPAALPRLFVALRLAAGIAVIVAVTVEIAANPLGLGYGLMSAQQTLQPALTFALLLWVGVVGWALNAGLLLAQRRLFGAAGEGRG